MKTVAALATCLLLTACATRWVNPKNPGASLQADEATCQREAEPVSRLENMIRPPGGADNCIACTTRGPDDEFKKINMLVGVQKNCMANKGWRQA